MATSLAEARQAKSHASELFPRYGKVVGVGIKRSNDGFALKVNFETRPEGLENLPREVDGVPVEIDVVGTIRAQG